MVVDLRIVHLDRVESRRECMISVQYLWATMPPVAAADLQDPGGWWRSTGRAPAGPFRW